MRVRNKGMPSKYLTEQEVEAVVASGATVPAFASDEFKQLAAESAPAEQYTGNVPLIEDKEAISGIPFIVTEFKQIQSDMSENGYVNVRILLPNMKEACFNDGGVGIMPILEDHAEAVGVLPTLDAEGDVIALPEGSKIIGGGHFVKPMYCANGLRKSAYVNAAGIAGTTFYFG